MASSHKDTRQLLRALKDQGFVVQPTKGKHYRVFHPSDPAVFVILPSTPSDRRGLMNGVAMLRRKLGFRWKGR